MICSISTTVVMLAVWQYVCKHNSKCSNCILYVIVRELTSYLNHLIWCCRCGEQRRTRWPHGRSNHISQKSSACPGGAWSEGSGPDNSPQSAAQIHLQYGSQEPAWHQLDTQTFHAHKNTFDVWMYFKRCWNKLSGRPNMPKVLNQARSILVQLQKTINQVIVFLIYRTTGVTDVFQVLKQGAQSNRKTAETHL